MMNVLRLLPTIAVYAPIGLFAVPLSLQVSPANETCSYANGVIDITVNGGAPPYTYSWSDGPIISDRSNLSAGTYTITVTDALSAQVSETVTIQSLGYDIDVLQPWQHCNEGGIVVSLLGLPVGATEPWLFNGFPSEPLYVEGTLVEQIFYPGTSPYAMTFSDGNGCSGTIQGELGPQITSWPSFALTSVEPSCTNENIGAIHLLASAAPQNWDSQMPPMVHLLHADGTLAQQTATASPDDLEMEFGNLAPGTYKMFWWLGFTMEVFDPGECNVDTVWATVPSLGASCGTVSGTSWFDVNGDCVHDANEVGIPESPLLLQPSAEVVLTSSNGSYSFPLTNGNYTLEQTDPTLLPICPVVQPVPFTVNTDDTVIDFANGSTQPLDLQADLSGTVFRPGFDAHYHVHARNLSPQVSGPVTVTCTLDPALTYLSATPPPSVAGNVLTWDLAAFNSFQNFNATVQVNVPVGTPLGTFLNSDLAVSNTLFEPDLSNNTWTETDVVVGSFDPNDKRAITSTRWSDSQYFIDEDSYIDYTIRFQNTGSFPAEFIVITDTIASELDMLSFEQGAASHPYQVTFKPGRVIEWRFDNIHLPDSTSDELGSHGLVRFRVKPVVPLLPGTVIENTANIFFDFNLPVITEPSVLVAEMSTAVVETPSDGLMVFPNPSHDALMITTHSPMRSVQVFAADGRLVLERQLSDRMAHFSVAALHPGNYALAVRLVDGTLLREHIIKY